MALTTETNSSVDFSAAVDRILKENPGDYITPKDFTTGIEKLPAGSDINDIYYATILYNRKALAAQQKAKMVLEKKMSATLSPLAPLMSNSAIEPNAASASYVVSKTSISQTAKTIYEELLIWDTPDDVQAYLDDIDDKRVLFEVSCLLLKDKNRLLRVIKAKKNQGVSYVNEESELKRIEMIRDSVINYEQRSPDNSQEYPNVIILNGWAASFIASNKAFQDDIRECVKRFFVGWISNSRMINDMEIHLFEAKYNGVRILYFKAPNNTYVLADVFLKDKGKSLEITAEYNAAVRDFKEKRAGILNAINNPEDSPEFFLEQQTLRDELFSALGIESIGKEVSSSEKGI